MRQFISFVIKETRHILRDRLTLTILFGMPVVMLLLFGFAISTDVRDVRVVVVAPSACGGTQQLTDKIDASPYFNVLYIVENAAAAERLMRDQRADMALVFSRRYSANPQECVIQLLVDGTDPNTALMRTAYMRQVIVNPSSQPVVSRMLYNPQMKSAYNFVPGIMGVLLMLICAMMTSVSIVREKERGTMEALLVSPVRPVLIIMGKAVPYFLLSLVILATILLLSHNVLDVPLSGNLMAIFLVSMLYILLALSSGILISVAAKSQLVAMLVSGMLLLMPSILLSGMIYPTESMPDILQWISCAMPARWFISAIKKLMIMGVPWQMAIKEISIMAAMTLLILGTALVKFKTRLE